MTRTSKIFNISNLYIIIWLLYNFHWNDVGQLFPLFENLSIVFLAINLGVSLICAVIVLTKYPTNVFFRYTNILLSLFIIYGLFHLLFDDDFNNISKGAYLIGALRTFLPIYTFYLFTKLGYLTEDTIRWWFWIFLLDALVIYFSFRNVLEVSDMYEVRTNNRAYLLASLLPFVYFFRNKPWIQYVILSIILALTIFSVKRGAVLTVMLGTIYFFSKKFKNVAGYRKFLVFIVVIVFFIIGRHFVEALFVDSEVFQKRVSDTLSGDTSNRNLIVSNLLNKYLDGGLFPLLFGYGADATLKEGLFAHNDWVEVLYNQGIVGLVAYFNFWLAWILVWRRRNAASYGITLLFGLLFVCNFPKTLFSMWYSNANMFVTLPLGYCLANIFVRFRKDTPPERG